MSDKRITMIVPSHLVRARFVLGTPVNGPKVSVAASRKAAFEKLGFTPAPKPRKKKGGDA